MKYCNTQRYHIIDNKSKLKKIKKKDILELDFLLLNVNLLKIKTNIHDSLLMTDNINMYLFNWNNIIYDNYIFLNKYLKCHHT